MHDIWQSMLHDIERAKKHVHLEQYILRGGKIGNSFFSLLKEKARQGVETKVILDVFGSWPVLANRKIRRELREAGVQVKWYNPITAEHFVFLTKNYYRTHRKLLEVDNEVGHLGGAGIDDSMASWLDMHGRIVEPEIVDGINRSFLELWETSHLPVPHALSATLGKGKRTYELLMNSASRGRRYIYYAMKHAVARARKRVWLVVPYFIPHRSLARLLKQKAQSGIDVRLLLPERSDLPLLDLAARSFVASFLEAGVKVMFYQDSILHTKALLVDDSWATFGSMNWDSKSFLHNLEANLVLHKPEDISRVETVFLESFAKSKHMSYAEWDARGSLGKFSEALMKPFHKII